MDEDRFREFLARVTVPTEEVVELLLRQEAHTMVLLAALTEFLHDSGVVDRERFDPGMARYAREHEEGTRAQLRARFAQDIMRSIRGPMIGQEDEEE